MKRWKIRKEELVNKAICLCLAGMMIFTMQRVPMMAAETESNAVEAEGSEDKENRVKAADKEEKASAPVQQIVSEGLHTGALTRDGNLYMWGCNTNGELGNGTTKDSNVPIKVMENIKSVSLGGTHCGAVTEDGSLYMWGSNRVGELGSGRTGRWEYRTVPKKLMENVESVSLTESHGISRAITKDGSLYAWGWNEMGHLGDGTTTTRERPVKILEDVKTLCSGERNAAAITKDGSLYMWGENDCGQLGDGTTKDRLKPIKAMENVQSASLKEEFTGAITEDGSLYMWGKNDCGQLGNGTTIDSNVPIKVMDNAENIALGYEFGGAITKDGSLYMWGRNDCGQLGNGTTIDSNVPIKVMDNVRSIRLDRGESAAITKDGSLYMWGSGLPLEDEQKRDSLVPVKILENVQSVAENGAVTEDGKLYMWGWNYYGQLGDGTNTDSPIPKLIRFFSDQDTISSFTLPTTATGSVNVPLSISGKLAISKDVQISEDILTSEVRDISWTSSSPDIIDASKIMWNSLNADDNRSATVLLSVTPKKEGKVTITGRTSNGLTASCQVTVKNNPVSAFQIDADTSGAPDVSLHISGRITLSKSGAGAEGILASEARNIKWSSSDSSIAEVAECKVKSYLGDQIANLDITITPYKAGTATISGKTSNGKVASCKVTVKDDGKLGLKSVMYSYGSKTVDVLKSAHSVELEHKPFQLICTPDGNDLIKRYQLYSGKKKLYENTDGNFKEVDPSKFTKGEDVILQVYSDKKSLTALLLLEITDKKPLIGSLKLGDELAFTLDDDVPFVGGTEMKVSLPDIPVNAVIEDGKIKIGINIKEKELYAYNTEEGVTTTNKKKKGIKESFQDWKSESKKMGEEKDTYKASLLNNNYEEYLEKKDFKADMPFMSDKIKVTAVGYGEATWSDSLETVRLELIVTLSGSTTFQSQIFVFEVPATVNCTVTGKGQVDADAGYDFIEQKFFGNVGLEISVSVEPYLGVGVGTYLSGGAYGQLKLGSGITVISTKKKSGVDNIYLAGELGAKAYFAKKEILRIPLFSIGDLKWTRLGQYINNKDQLLIYSRDGNSLIKKEASAKEAALPEPVFQWSEAEDSVYLSAPARMGEKAVTIVENAYGAAAPQIVTAGDTTLAVYLDNDTSRALAIWHD